MWKLSEPHIPGVLALSGDQVASGSPPRVASLEQKMLRVPFPASILQGFSGALCQEPGAGRDQSVYFLLSHTPSSPVDAPAPSVMAFGGEAFV